MSIFRKKVPIVLQIEAAECGAASLCMVLGYYGRYVELSDMRKECKVSRDGTTLRNIMDAAEKYGMEARSYKTRSKNLCKLSSSQSKSGSEVTGGIDPKSKSGSEVTGGIDPQSKSGSKGTGGIDPLIVFWQGRHYLVVEELTDKKAVLCDPACGRRKITREEFDDNYSGIVLQLAPGLKFSKGGKPFSSNGFLLKTMLRSPDTVAYLSILIILINVVGIIIPYMSSTYVDRILPSDGNSNIAVFFCVFLATVIIQFILLYIQKRIVLLYEKYLSADTTDFFFKKLVKLPLEYFQSRGHTSMLSRICSIDSISNLAASYYLPIILGLLFSVAYIIILFSYSVKIAIAVILVLIPVIIIMLYAAALTRDDNLRNEHLKVSYSSNVIQDIQLFDTLKASAFEKEAAVNTINAYVDYSNSMQQTRARTAVINSFPATVPLFIQAVTIVFGCALTFRGEMTLGGTLACQSIAMSIFGPISSFISGMSSIDNQETSIRALNDIAHEETDIISERKAPAAGIQYDSIEMENVSFAYNTSEGPVVHDISLRVEAGQSMALVGGTGSGKSTILKLIEGLYIPQEGSISFNGISLMDTNREELGSSVAVISQSPYLFTGSVYNNITMLDPEISEEAVVQALRDACVYDDICQRKDCIHHIVEASNSGFSGGQVQRMMIARALVRDPGILIMDEATSALDPIVETEVIDHIKSRGMTLIIVAHRLSTIRDCDQILVLDGGTIAERGTHEQLVNDPDSKYRQLIMSEEDEA